MLHDAEVLHAVLHAINDLLASQQVAHGGHGYHGADARALQDFDIGQFTVDLDEGFEYLAAFMLIIIQFCLLLRLKIAKVFRTNQQADAEARVELVVVQQTLTIPVVVLHKQVLVCFFLQVQSKLCNGVEI